LIFGKKGINTARGQKDQHSLAFFKGFSTLMLFKAQHTSNSAFVNGQLTISAHLLK